LRISQFDFEPLPIKIKGSGKIKKDEIQSSKLKSQKEKNVRSLRPMQRSSSARRIEDKTKDKEPKTLAFQNKKINEKEERSQPLQNNFVISENENVFFLNLI